MGLKGPWCLHEGNQSQASVAGTEWPVELVWTGADLRREARSKRDHALTLLRAGHCEVTGLLKAMISAPIGTLSLLTRFSHSPRCFFVPGSFGLDCYSQTRWPESGGNGLEKHDRLAKYCASISVCELQPRPGGVFVFAGEVLGTIPPRVVWGAPFLAPSDQDLQNFGVAASLRNVAL